MIKVRSEITDRMSRERMALEVKRARRPALIYAGLIVVTIVIGAMVLSHSRIVYPWETPRKYTLTVQNAAGVRPGLQDVRISGMKAGVISDATTSDGRALITVSVDRRYGPLYADARAVLQPQSPLQDMYVDIVDRGDRASGELQGPLPASRTSEDVDLGHVLNIFDAPTRASLEHLLDSLGAGLDDRGRMLREAFASIGPFLQEGGRLTRELGRRGRITRELVHDVSLLMATLGDRDTELASLVRHGNATFSQSAAQASALDATLSGLPDVLEKLNSSLPVLRAALDNLDPALDDLRPAAGRLPEGLRSLEAIGHEATPAIERLRPVVGRLQHLSDSLPRTAESLSETSDSLRPQAPELDRITQKMVPCRVALQRFFAQTPSLVKFSDPHGVIPRGQAAQGTETIGGLIADAALKRLPSCVEEANK